MKKQKWGLLNSIRNGAIFGLLYGLYDLYQGGMPIGSLQWYFVFGQLSGSLTGGAIMFLIGAGVRNKIVKF